MDLFDRFPRFVFSCPFQESVSACLFCNAEFICEFSPCLRVGDTTRVPWHSWNTHGTTGHYRSLQAIAVICSNYVDFSKVLFKASWSLIFFIWRLNFTDELCTAKVPSRFGRLWRSCEVEIRDRTVLLLLSLDISHMSHMPTVMTFRNSSHHHRHHHRHHHTSITSWHDLTWLDMTLQVLGRCSAFGSAKSERPKGAEIRRCSEMCERRYRYGWKIVHRRWRWRKM